MNRFLFSVRGLLVAMLMTCMAVILIQRYLARKEFSNVKNETTKTLLSLDWKTAQHGALQETLEQITYENRFIPKIAFASIEEALIAKKLESLGMGPHLLCVGWFDLSRSVDCIRFSLKNGGHIDYQLQEGLEYDPFYRQATLFLGQVGIDNGREIESVSLMSNGETFATPVSPIFLLPASNAE